MCINNNKIITEAFQKITEKYQVSSFAVTNSKDSVYQTSNYEIELMVSGGDFIQFRLNYHGQLIFVEVSRRTMNNSIIRVLGELVALFGPIIEK